MKKLRIVSALCLSLILLCAPLCTFFASAAGSAWVTAWTSSIVNGSVSVAGLSLNDIIPSGRTVRTVLQVTTSGSALRFCFSNEYGNAPITISAASVAKAGDSGSAIKSSTSKSLTFNGQYSVTIPAGGRIWSDNVQFSVSALDKIVVGTYFRDMVYMKSVGLSNGRTYMNTVGTNAASQCTADKLTLPTELKLTSGTVTYHTVPFLCEIEAYSKYSDPACAVFIGDSTLVNDTYLYYAQRLASAGVKNVSVVNQAIIGNRLLSETTGNLIGSLFGKSVLDRFSRDVLNLSGVKYVFVKIGLNDIAHQYSKSLGADAPKVSAEDIIKGYEKLITLCHNRGIKIYFFTASAWKGYTRAFLGSTDDLTWNEQAQAECDKLTKWAKTNKLADGCIDCSPLADPSDPNKLCSTLTLDGAHLSALGSVALADLIPVTFAGATKGGRTAASINNVDPYAERNQILYNLEHPTKAPETTTEKKEESTTAKAEESTTIIVVREEPATNPQENVTQQRVEEYTVISPADVPGLATTAADTTAAVPDYIVPSTTQVAPLTPVNPNGGSNTSSGSNAGGRTQELNVKQIGGSGGIAFALLLFPVIIVLGAVLYFTLAKKKTVNIDDTVPENTSAVH